MLAKRRLKLKARSRVYYFQKILLLIFDLVSINSAFILSFYIFRYKQTFYGKIITDLGVNHLLSLVAISLVWGYIFKEKGLYRQIVYSRLGAQIILVVKAVTLGSLLFLACSFMIKSPYFIERRDLIFCAWLFSITFIAISRSILFYPYTKYIVKKGLDKKRVIILGAGWHGQNLAKHLSQAKRVGYFVIGFLDDDPLLRDKEYYGYPVLGTLSDLEAVIYRKKIKEVMIAMSGITHKKTLDLISQCKKLRVNVKLVSDLFSVITEKVTVESLAGIPLIGIKEPRLQGVNRILKRLLDICVSSIALLVLSPFFFFVGLMIRLTSKGPVFYKQERISRKMKPFNIYKFRSMYRDCDESKHQDYVESYINGNDEKNSDGNGDVIHKLVNDSRITSFGKFLRKTSIDELPQLINVFKGDMSLVGPRPPIPYEVNLYDEWHRRRLDVSPGMTGLWQVSGRNGMDFNEMVILDIYYIENWSIWMDVEILIKTIPALVQHSKGH